jgi:hypothetical protein
MKLLKHHDYRLEDWGATVMTEVIYWAELQDFCSKEVRL